MNERILELESSQLFAKQSQKTQVITSNSVFSDIYKTRQTHVYEVRTVSEMIAKKIGFKRIEELAIVSMSHDLGHPPFGHKGAKTLDRVIKSCGLKEGFSDNNNNLDMIEQNGLSFTDYELISLIKYPNKLYKYQKEKYIPVMERIVLEESKIWGKNLSRTVACNIMDIADEISYTTSDLYDSYSTGFISGELIGFQFKKLSEKYKSQPKLYSILNGISNAGFNNYKRVLRDEIFKLKLFLTNNCYWNYSEANLKFSDNESKELLSDIFSFTFKYFINSKKNLKKRSKVQQKFEKFIRFFLATEDKYMTSDMYREKYKIAKTKEDKLRIIRHMCSDTTDEFVINFKLVEEY